MSTESYKVHDKIGKTTKIKGGTTMDYRQRLKETRIDKDLTQEDAAAALETTRQQIYKYENCTQEMTASKLRTLCLYYNVSADYILGLPRGLEWPR